MDIPELAHLCDSYAFVRELTDTAPQIIMSVYGPSTVNHSISVHAMLMKTWGACATTNHAFRDKYYAQFAHCRVTRRRLSQSLLVMLQLAESSKLITSVQDRNCSIGFCGWISFTVVIPEAFNNLVREMHPGNPRKSVVDNYLNAMLREVGMHPLHNCWARAWSGQDEFIFVQRHILRGPR
jgi:hypothetical protein